MFKVKTDYVGGLMFDRYKTSLIFMFYMCVYLKGLGKLQFTW